MGQGAGNNRGQAAGNGRFVKFTHGAAQRIAKAVRVVEGGDRNQPGITFDHPLPSAGNVKAFRICTFTGSWSIGSSKVVTFKYATATPNTASATNLFFPVTSTGTKDCAIAKDGTAWFLIDVPLATASAVFVTGVTQGISVTATSQTAVMTDVTLSASLNTSACTITINKTLVTASYIFVTGTATAVFVTGTATATYLRLE